MARTKRSDDSDRVSQWGAVWQDTSDGEADTSDREADPNHSNSRPKTLTSASRHPVPKPNSSFSSKDARKKFLMRMETKLPREIRDQIYIELLQPLPQTYYIRLPAIQNLDGSSPALFPFDSYMMKLFPKESRLLIEFVEKFYAKNTFRIMYPHIGNFSTFLESDILFGMKDVVPKSWIRSIVMDAGFMDTLGPNHLAWIPVLAGSVDGRLKARDDPEQMRNAFLRSLRLLSCLSHKTNCEIEVRTGFNNWRWKIGLSVFGDAKMKAFVEFVAPEVRRLRGVFGKESVRVKATVCVYELGLRFLDDREEERVLDERCLNEDGVDVEGVEALFA